MTSDGNWEVGGRGTGGVKIRICDSPSTTTTASCYPRKAPLVADIYLYKFEDVEVGFITKHSMTGPSVNKLKLLYCFSWISRSFVALDFQLAYIRLNVFFLCRYLSYTLPYFLLISAPRQTMSLWLNHTLARGRMVIAWTRFFIDWLQARCLL